MDGTRKTREKENSSQFKSMICKQSMTAINDLIIIAEKTDEDVQEDVFTTELLSGFMEAVLGNRIKEENTKEAVENINLLKKELDEEKNPAKKKELQKVLAQNSKILNISVQVLIEDK